MTKIQFRLPLLPSKIRWFVVGSTLVVIFYFSIITAPGPDRLEFGPFGILPFSTWLHGIAYAGLAITLAYALVRSPQPNTQILFGVFLVATGYGIGIEVMQLTLPDRTFDEIDVLVNGIGAAIAVTVWNIVVRYIEFYPI